MLDSARKYAQKGAKAKALKEYQLLLQADPRDAKLLLEVGDTYRRWGQAEDAIAQYAKVAQQYRQDGFDARAVAVYKQILNLDPKHYAAYVSLSELYQRMGLDSEAIGALQTAADGYHREGRKTDALELLRQMAALDPTNTTSRLKVAELLRQEKMNAEALAEYEAAARELENQQDRDQLLAVRERILELKPDHVGALTGMVRSLMIAGQLERAEPFALRALQASGEPPQYELMIELFAQMGNDAKLAEATRGLAKLYRDRGDEDKARELMQRLPADEVGARSRLAVDVSEVDEPDLGDDDLIDDDPFVTVPGKAAANGPALARDELELDGDDEIQLEVPRKKAAPAPSAPLEGDPDQLLAEASVYLRYGKRAQAMASLKSVLEQDPNHRAALEKLGEAYVDDGQPAEAVGVWMRAAEQIKKQGDAKALSVLRDRIATLDPKAAATLVVPAPSGGNAAAARKPAIAAAPAPAPEAEVELELSLDDAVDEGAAGLEADANEEGADAADDAGLGFEVEIDTDGIDLGLDLPESDEVSSTSVEVAAASASSLELSEDGSFEFEIDPGEISSDGNETSGIEGLSEAELGAMGELEGNSVFTDADANSVSARPGSTTTTARIQEELEEAEFYIAQEMYDEAEASLTRILEIAPNHPSALLRMGEVQVARGASPEAVPATSESRTRAGRRVAGTSEHDLGSTARFDEGLDLDASGEGDDEALDAGQSASGIEVDVDVDIDVDVDVELDSDPDPGPALELAPPVAARTERKSEAPAAKSEAAIVLPRTPIRPAPRVALDVTEEAEAEIEVELDAADDVEIDVAGETGSEVAVERGPVLEASKTATPAAIADANEYADLSLDDDDEPEAPVAETSDSSNAASVATDVPDDALAAAADPGDSFDLREALADVFADPGESARERGASAVLSTVEDGFESIFSDFKKGVSATLGAGDYDTRYDLGIAYREMGLYEDAIGEFKICLEAPSRRFDSLYLMGLCARDLQRYTDAVHHLEQALALPDLPSERLAGVFFDLSLAQALAGDRERARANMKRVLELDRAFPGAAEKLAELEAPVGSEVAASAVGASASGGRFESFDDLFSEDEEIPEATVESFESFDDVVSDASTDVVAPPSREPEPEPAPAAAPASETPRKGPRKKISFV